MSDIEKYHERHLPESVPVTSGDLSIDHIVRGMAEIAFDRTERPAVRLAALKELGKHKGMFIERHEVRTLDTSKQEAARALFSQMSPSEKRAWLDRHINNLESALMRKEYEDGPRTPPEDPELTIPVQNQLQREKDALRCLKE